MNYIYTNVELFTKNNLNEIIYYLINNSNKHKDQFVFKKYLIFLINFINSDSILIDIFRLFIFFNLKSEKIRDLIVNNISCLSEISRYNLNVPNNKLYEIRIIDKYFTFLNELFLKWFNTNWEDNNSKLEYYNYKDDCEK